MITPEQLAKSGTEHGHQAALFCWASTYDSPLIKYLYSVPNGFFATPGQKAKMKAEGLKSGVPDICLPVRIYRPNRVVAAGLYIELKVPSKRSEQIWNGASEDQIDWGKFLISQGYYFYVAYGWTDARDCIIAYLEGQCDNHKCWRPE